MHEMRLYRGVIYERVSGLKLGTIEKAPPCSESLTMGFSREEEIVTDDTIKKLLKKWFMTKYSHEYEDLFSLYLCDKSMIVLSALFLT